MPEDILELHECFGGAYWRTTAGNKKKSADDTMHSSLLQSQSTSLSDDDTEAERVWKIKQQLDAIKAEVQAFAINLPLPESFLK